MFSLSHDSFIYFDKFLSRSRGVHFVLIDVCWNGYSPVAVNHSNSFAISLIVLSEIQTLLQAAAAPPLNLVCVDMSFSDTSSRCLHGKMP